MSETKNARLNDLSPDEFRRLYDGFAIKDARIAELEAALMEAQRFIIPYAFFGQEQNPASPTNLYKRIDKLLSKGE